MLSMHARSILLCVHLPPPPVPRRPTHYSHGPSDRHPKTMGQIWSEHLPQPLLALQPILRQYYRLDNRLTPNRNIEQQNIKRWKGRNGMGEGGTNEARKGQREADPPRQRRSRPSAHLAVLLLLLARGC